MIDPFARPPSLQVSGQAEAALDLKALDCLSPDHIVPGRNRSKADILRFPTAGDPVALKDYRRRPVWIRATLGHFLIGREARAYQAAQGVHGIPRFLGRLGPVSLATAWVDGVPLSDFVRKGPDAPPREVFDHVDRILDGLHRQGIALADLHRRNILVSRDGQVHVVDLATAYTLPTERGLLGPLRRWAFLHICQLDRIAAARIRAHFTGGDEKQAVDSIGGLTAGCYKVVRRLKSVVRPRRKKRRVPGGRRG